MRTTKRILATGLALVLLLTTVAFAETSTSTEEEIAKQYSAYDETVTIITAKRSSASPGFLEGDDVENNPMTRYIKDTLNVEIEVEWETETSEFANKIALMLAAGSLPDMFALSKSDYLLFKQLLENDMLEPLGDVYDEYANDYVKNTLATYNGENFAPFYGDDGELYAIVSGNYGYEYNLLWVREDWLDELGLSMPTTIEEMEEVLKAFKENPPSDTYTGMMLNASSVGGVYDSYSASPIFGAYDAYPGMWTTDEDGNAVWGSVQPQVKEGLAILAEWYAEGLIDPEFMTRTASGANEAQITGELTGLFFAPWWLGYSISDFNEQNPDAVLTNINAPLDSDGMFNVAFPSAAGSFICVRKGYEYPEAVVKVINLEFDMWRGFNEEAAALILETRNNGVDWEYLFPTSYFNVESNYGVPESGEIAHALVNGTDYSDLSYNPQTLLMAEQAKEYAELGNDAPAGDWLSYFTRYIGADPSMMYADNLEIHYPTFAFTTDSMADIKPNLDTLEQTTFLKIITGELSIDAFDEFVEEWYAQGGQIMTDEVNALLNE